MTNQTVAVFAPDTRGLFRLMYRASRLAMSENAALELYMISPGGTPAQQADWLDKTYRCAQYFDARLKAYADFEALGQALEAIHKPSVRWAVVGGAFDFVKRIHGHMPGVPILSHYEHTEKGGAAASAV